MKKIFLTAAVILYSLSINAQTMVKIGDLEFALQSPISISKDSTRKTGKNVFKGDSFKKKINKNIKEFYIGYGVALNTKEESYLPVYYGNSYNLELGYRYLYRPAKAYAIGTFFQYSSYSYRMKNAAANNIFVQGVPGDVYREYFRTDNLGTGIINRFYLFPLNSRKPLYIELGGYFDYSYSKRYKVKTKINGDKEKIKYRDGSKFNPFEAGFQGAISKSGITLYARYRATDFFDHNQITLELPRWSLGVQIDL